jgi:hypothetical protein
MSAPRDLTNQQFPNLLDASPESVRSVMDAASIARAWAARILETSTSLTRHQRQNLYDISRPHRITTINRSPFGLLFDYAPFAPIQAATWGPTLFKVEIVGRGDYRMPSEDDAHDHEERTNYLGNLAQYRRKERRTLSTRFDVVDAMNAQALASEQVALTAAVTR